MDAAVLVQQSVVLMDPKSRVASTQQETHERESHKKLNRHGKVLLIQSTNHD